MKTKIISFLFDKDRFTFDVGKFRIKEWFKKSNERGLKRKRDYVSTESLRIVLSAHKVNKYSYDIRCFVYLQHSK
jgi:hypothetical protein